MQYADINTRYTQNNEKFLRFAFSIYEHDRKLYSKFQFSNIMGETFLNSWKVEINLFCRCTMSEGRRVSKSPIFHSHNGNQPWISEAFLAVKQTCGFSWKSCHHLLTARPDNQERPASVYTVNQEIVIIIDYTHRLLFEIAYVIDIR